MSLPNIQNPRVPMMPKNEGGNQVGLWADLPQERTAKRSHSNKHIADQIVEPKHACFTAVRGKIHDQCFAGGLAKLFQPSYDKSNNQPF